MVNSSGRRSWQRGMLRPHKNIFSLPKKLRDQEILDKKDRRNQPYVIRQIAHDVCKKDHPKVMENTPIVYVSVTNLFDYIDMDIMELSEDEVAAQNAFQDSKFAMLASEEEKDGMAQSWQVEVKESRAVIWVLRRFLKNIQDPYINNELFYCV